MYDTHCIANNIDKYDPEAFMIYNKVCAHCIGDQF